MSLKNVLIYGWFGEGNIGDELLLDAAIALVEDALPNSSIRVMGPKPREIESFHTDKALDLVSTYFDRSLKSKARLFKYGPLKAFRNAREADVIIFVTGGALSDWNPASTKTLFDLICYWKTKGKRMFMFGVGAGPISKPESYEPFRRALSNIECITVRDDYSYRELIKTGLNNVIQTKDLVFELHRSGVRDVKEMSCVKKIGVVAAPVCLETPQIYSTFRQSLSQAVGNLVENGYEVSLIPFQPHYDSDLMDYIHQENPSSRLLIDKSRFWFPLAYLQEQDLIIGQRFHSLVESVAASKLVVPIVYHPKCWSFCVDFGLDQYASFVGNGHNWQTANVDPDDLCHAVETVQRDKEYFQRIKNVWAGKCADNTERQILAEI